MIFFLKVNIIRRSVLVKKKILKVENMCRWFFMNVKYELYFDSGYNLLVSI